MLARAYEPGKAPSAVVSRTYIALAADVLSFSSNLPIVIVDTSRRNIGTNFAGVSSVLIDTGAQGRAKITDAPDFAGRAGIKKRGSSTGSQAKPQYGFEVWDENNRDRDAAILGMPADSDWVLYAPYTYDRALINNAFIYNLSNEIGRYAVRTRFVEMYVNSNDDTVSASDYVGLYIFMEKIKRGEERVNVEELEPWDSTAPRISGGYMLKIDQVDPADHGFRTARGNPTYGDGTMCYVDPKESEITAAQVRLASRLLRRVRKRPLRPQLRRPRDRLRQVHRRGLLHRSQPAQHAGDERGCPASEHVHVQAPQRQARHGTDLGLRPGPGLRRRPG